MMVNIRAFYDICWMWHFSLCCNFLTTHAQTTFTLFLFLFLRFHQYIQKKSCCLSSGVLLWQFGCWDWLIVTYIRMFATEDLCNCDSFIDVWLSFNVKLIGILSVDIPWVFLFASTMLLVISSFPEFFIRKPRCVK